jgi:valyl-tRNA synthetase
MFEDLYDTVSLIFSRLWPEAQGEITAIDVERMRHSQGADTLRLAVAYKFSLGDDGPYTGESFWQPAFFVNKRVAAARHKLHLHQAVVVHYRSDDPSVNKLDRSLWRTL